MNPRPPPPASSPEHPKPSDEQTDPFLRLAVGRSRFVAVLISGGFSAIGLGAIAIAFTTLEARAQDAGSSAAKLETAPVVATVNGHEARLQVLEQTSKQTQADVHEARGELRDLYKAVMEGKRSERLERPLPPLPTDGGR